MGEEKTVKTIKSISKRKIRKRKKSLLLMSFLIG